MKPKIGLSSRFQIQKEVRLSEIELESKIKMWSLLRINLVKKNFFPRNIPRNKNVESFHFLLEFRACQLRLHWCLSPCFLSIYLFLNKFFLAYCCILNVGFWIVWVLNSFSCVHRCVGRNSEVCYSSWLTWPRTESLPRPSVHTKQSSMWHPLALRVLAREAHWLVSRAGSGHIWAMQALPSSLRLHFYQGRF